MIDIVKTAIKALLAADATFISYIPDTRIFANVREIKRNAALTSGAFNANSEVLPSCLIKAETFNQFGPLMDFNASMGFIVLAFYQYANYSTIYPAQSRARELLHMNCVTKTWEIHWADDVYDLEDEALECSLLVSRYQVIAKAIG